MIHSKETGFENSAFVGVYLVGLFLPDIFNTHCFVSFKKNLQKVLENHDGQLVIDILGFI